MSSEKEQKIGRKEAARLLDEIYAKAIQGIPLVSKSIDEVASDYLAKNDNPSKAAKSLIKYQMAKCGTSGFLTGLGGIITLPVAVPANVGSVLYVQMRMIAAVAKIGGFDVESDQVQTLVYACMTGSAAADILKQTGIKVGTKMTEAAIAKIPGKILVSINQKVGFRLITKFGEKGAINLVKMVPIAGGLIGATVDLASTKVIASNAYKLFIKKEMLTKEDKRRKKAKSDNIVDEDINIVVEESDF